MTGDGCASPRSAAPRAATPRVASPTTGSRHWGHPITCCRRMSRAGATPPRRFAARRLAAQSDSSPSPATPITEGPQSRPRPHPSTQHQLSGGLCSPFAATICRATFATHRPQRAAHAEGLVIEALTISPLRM
jgi:hypothetical protein